MKLHERPRKLSERQGKWMLNLFPPLFFSRVRVLEFGPGYRTCKVEVARSLLTRNLQGTTFGGTIFSAADPIYAIMYWQIFARRGLRVQAWLKSARIAYRRPAASTLLLRFALSDEDVQAAVDALEAEGRFERTFQTDAIDREGEVCATIETQVHLRLPGVGQRELSAF